MHDGVEARAAVPPPSPGNPSRPGLTELEFGKAVRRSLGVVTPSCLAERTQGNGASLELLSPRGDRPPTPAPP